MPFHMYLDSHAYAHDTVNASSKDFIALHQTIAQAYWALTIWEILICDFGGCVLGFRGGASLTFGTLICFYCYCYVYFTPCPPNNGNSEPPLQIKLALQHHYTYISITCQSTKLTKIGWLLYSFQHSCTHNICIIIFAQWVTSHNI